MVEEVGLETGAEDGVAVKPPVDWLRVRAAYEGTGGTLPELAKRFGTSTGAISYRVKHQNWHMRKPGTRSSGAILLSRLYGLLERQLSHMENETTEMGEKEAAVLSRVAATLEKLIHIERTSAPPKAPKRASKDLQYLRNKIAQRLDELDQRQR